MKKSLKQFVIEYNISNEYLDDKEGLFDTFDECFDVVWRGEPDSHRWYTNYDTVKKVTIDEEDRYFKHYEMRPDGENSREDCGFEIPDLDDIKEVFPKEVKTIIYE